MTGITKFLAEAAARFVNPSTLNQETNVASPGDTASNHKGEEVFRGRNMHRKHSGFTIVELVVVIILLGILAATALPRFINIDDDAHDAAFAAVQGGLQTGIAMFHAQWVAEDQPAADSQFADFNQLRTNSDGFPYGLVDNGPNGNVADENDCVAVFQNVMQAGAPAVVGAANLAAVAGAGANVDFVAVASATPDCTYYHTAPGTATGTSVGTLTYDPADGSLLAGTHTF